MDKVISCIVLAAGAGRRMGYKENKIFIPLGKFSIIQRTIQNVEKIECLKEIILVVAEGEQEYMSNHIQGLDLHIPVKIVLGGRERQDSVAYGLKAVSEDSNIVLVHDGARPLASTKLFDSVVSAAIVSVAETPTVAAPYSIAALTTESNSLVDANGRAPS